MTENNIQKLHNNLDDSMIVLKGEISYIQMNHQDIETLQGNGASHQGQQQQCAGKSAGASTALGRKQHQQKQKKGHNQQQAHVKVVATTTQ